MLKRLILPAALLLATGSALAQQPAAQTPPAAGTKPAQPALTKEQQEFRARMAANAQGVARTIDKGDIGAVWDQGSDLMKQAVTRDAFVSGVQAERNKAGKMESRKLVRMYRINSKGEKKLPAGSYLNVIFATKFSNEPQPVPELVSYHFDKDNVLRLSGYTVEQPAAQKSTANGQ